MPAPAQSCETALRNLGHECDTVNDGNEAWEAFLASGPNVIISDWVMPGMTGLQLCRRIRASPRAGYTYLILVTVKGAREQIREGMSAGADDYLVKPLDPDELEARLIAAARVTALHRQLADQRAAVQQLYLELTIAQDR